MPSAPKEGNVRASVRIPRPIYEEARRFVDRAATPAKNFNDFFVAAVSAYVRLLKRKQIDAAFSGIAKDAEYQREAELIANEFGPSDWEAFALAERASSEA